MALLIKTDGTQTKVTPKNGKYFKFQGETYDLIDTDIIEVIGLDDGRIMLIDEEGKLKGKPINAVATLMFNHDVVVGDVIVCKSSEVR